MTTPALFTLGLLLQATSAPLNPTPVDTAAAADTQEVLVFLDRAIVTRVRRVACPPTSAPAAARFTTTFAGLPAGTDERTLRTQATGARIEGLRLTDPDDDAADDGDAGPHPGVGVGVAAADPATRAATARRQSVAEQIATTTAALARLDGRDAEVTSYLATTRAVIDRQLRDGRTAPTTWRQAFAAVERAGRAAAAERARLDALLERLNAEQATLERKLTGDRASTAVVQVVARCSNPGGRAELRLSYTVTGASWSPSYELHTRDAGRAVVLKVFATVRQRTGEDWRAARLVLTTADPTLPATPPKLVPLDVRAETRDPPRKQLVARAEAVPRAAGAQPPATPGTGTSVQASDQGMSVRLVATTAADVRGDGAGVVVRTAELPLPSQPALRAIPRLSSGVFRVVDLVNRAPFPLLPGPMKLFRDGDLIGTQPLAQAIPAGGRVSVSLGQEERLQVRRIVREEIATRRGGLFGGRQHRFAYRFEVESYLDQPVTLDLVDQLPVSQLEDVRVVADRRAAARWQVDPAHGLAHHQARLPPRGKASVDLAFHIDIPAAYD
jgi:uncharacterized protein (TIGR02231 family)